MMFPKRSSLGTPWCIIIILPLILVASQAFGGAYHEVLRVVDGDTIVVNYNGYAEKVRLLCVNTPESVHPDQKQNVPLGKVTSDYTKQRLAGKSVTLEFGGSRHRGKYGRLLAYVIVDGSNFNLELVRQGLSPYYTKYGKSIRYDAQFKSAEKQARSEDLNIWADSASTEKYLRLKSKWSQRASALQKQPITATGSGAYVGSKRSNKFHYPSCRWAKKIKLYNLRQFRSRDNAFNSGYVPCKVCRP